MLRRARVNHDVEGWCGLHPCRFYGDADPSGQHGGGGISHTRFEVSCPSHTSEYIILHWSSEVLTDMK